MGVEGRRNVESRQLRGGFKHATRGVVVFYSLKTSAIAAVAVAESAKDASSRCRQNHRRCTDNNE